MNNLAHLLPAHISSGNAAGDGIAESLRDGAMEGGAKDLISAGSVVMVRRANARSTDDYAEGSGDKHNLIVPSDAT